MTGGAPQVTTFGSWPHRRIAIPTEAPPGSAYEDCVARIELEGLAIDYEVVATGDERCPHMRVADSFLR